MNSIQRILSLRYGMVFLVILMLNAHDLEGKEGRKRLGGFPLLLEAESASSTDLVQLADGGASGGQFLRMAETGNVTWTFSMDTDGWYRIQVGYRNSGGDSENYLNKNGVEWKAGFGWSGSWDVHEKKVALNAGDNTIEIAAIAGNIDIDYLKIDTVIVHPEVLPSNNNYYLLSPRDLVLKMNSYGRSLTGVTCGGSALDYVVTPYPFLEDAWHVRISRSSLATLGEGHRTVFFNFDSGESAVMNLHVIGDTLCPLLTIIAPHVSHGNSVLILLPTGKTLLVDCGQAEFRDRIVIPILQKHGIDTLDYFLLTHYHSDHDGGDGGETIKTLFHVGQFWDYNDFSPGDRLDLESVRIKILNAHTGGTDENQNSVSFKLEFNGFVYIHGADIYANRQNALLNQFPADVRGHVYSANHHFHGSSDAEYMRAMDPIIVFVQAQEAMYARSAFTQTFEIRTAEWLKAHHKRFIDGLPTLEVGTVVIRANSGEEWSYETYGDTAVPFLPYLPQNMPLFEDRTNPPSFFSFPDSMYSTFQKSIHVTFITNKTAFLRFGTSDQPFQDLPFAFETGEGFTFHQTTLPGVQGQEVVYYIRAQDRYGNETPEAVTVTLRMDTLALPLYWYEKEYDDGDWKRGPAPLGYGAGSPATAILPSRTLFMRTLFFLSDAPEAMGLLLKGYDGFVAYINGAEVARLNVPDETTYESFALSKPPSPYAKVFVIDSLRLASFRTGENVLALEVHQADVAEPSISADARLFNGSGITFDLGGTWSYYDEGHDPPVLTHDGQSAFRGAGDLPPDDIGLESNFPNPFNPVTCIRYQVPAKSKVRIDIYDVTGKMVETLVDDVESPGLYTREWDAARFPSGMYICRMETTPYTRSQRRTIKMLHIK